VEKDCRARGLNREDAMEHCRWKKQIGMIDDHDKCECFFWYRLTRVVPDKIHRAVKWLCCVCCLAIWVFFYGNLGIFPFNSFQFFNVGNDLNHDDGD